MLKIKKNQTLEIKNFIKNYNNFNEIELLTQYKNICKNLLFYDEELVIKTIEILKKNIESWAQKYSQIYKELPNNIEYISKENLINKQKWNVNFLEKQSSIMKTSGTTGPKFQYLRWNKFFEFIEIENHYNLILEEYGIKQNPSVLYFFNNYTKFNEVVAETNSKNFMEKHGSKNATTYAINFDKNKVNLEYFYKEFFEWIDKKQIDVILAPGSAINAICYYFNKFKYNKKLCTLLSNTCEKFLKNDVNYLINNNYIDKFCDHMRCWDGGCTFITCKENNYHILDNLSYCFSIDSKLISTDYFSFVSPFVNYWNGDYCEISSIYKRCDCGRLFRYFKLLESRPFYVKGESVNNIKEAIINLGIKNKIKRVVCSIEEIEIISKVDIDIEIKSKLYNMFNIKFKFIVEE